MRGEGRVKAMTGAQRPDQEKAKELQRPVDVDTWYLTDLTIQRLNALGFRHQRSVNNLATDLVHLYEECISFIVRMNVLLEHPPEDVTTLSYNVAGLEVGLFSVQGHIRSSKAALDRLHGHLCDLGETEE